jgi:hypothetical protein
VRCGLWEVDRPGWLEADTVSHGGGGSSGEFMWSLTLTGIHTGWTELAGLWGGSGREVCVGLRRIEARMPFEMLGFDCDNGSEFPNTVAENHLLGQGRPPKWTRSRAYKKNDLAHIEQKNFTHVRQLLDYGRFDDLQQSQQDLRQPANTLRPPAGLRACQRGNQAEATHHTGAIRAFGRSEMNGGPASGTGWLRCHEIAFPVKASTDQVADRSEVRREQPLVSPCGVAIGHA